MFPMEVSFPSLGIEFSIDNVAFKLFGKEIYWYALLIAAGILLAFTYALFNSKRFGLNFDKLTDVAIIGIIFGIIGARIYYVVFNWDYYSKNPEEILRIDKGGIAIYGGIIGALISGVIATKVVKIDTLAACDIASVGFLIGQAVGRWGNFVNQEAFGTPTDLPWGMSSINTGGVPVHPCFLYESLWCLAGIILLDVVSRKAYKFKGQLLLMYIGWYGLGRVWIEGLRTDSLCFTVAGNDIRVSQLLAGVCVVVSVVLLIVFFVKNRKKAALSEEFVEAEV